MSYTDLTSAWAYRDIVSWKQMDGHAENSAEAYDELNNPYGARYQSGDGQSVSASTWTLQTSSNERFDSGAVMSSSRYDPARAGIHVVLGCVNFTRGATSHKRNKVAIYKNGSEEKQGDLLHSRDSVTTYRGAPQVIALILLDGNDYAEQYCWAEEAATVTNSAGNDYGTPGFMAERVGA